MQAATGRRPAGLATPQAPASLSYLLAYFGELAAARRMGMSAPEPIGWSEIAAWAGIAGVTLQAWEARVLRALDALWISAWRDGQGEPTASGKASARRH